MEKKTRKEDARSAMTRNRLLDAAEQVFAEEGYRGASLRVISDKAAANIAASNYHFGGKEGLFRAVMLRYAPIVRDERLRLLNLLQPDDSLHTIVEAYLLPTFTWLENLNPKNQTQPYFLRLLASCEVEAPHLSNEILKSLYYPVRKKLAEVLHTYFPHASKREIFWAQFSGDSIMFGFLMRLHQIPERSHGLVNTSDLHSLSTVLTKQIEAVFSLLEASNNARD